MDSRLTLQAVEAHIAEQRRGAGSPRGVRAKARRGPRPSPGVTIRMAVADDGPVLHRLAELDSQAAPTGPTLVAEQHGEVVAALPLREGSAVAHPFRRTADVVRLLELRARQLRGAPRAGLRRLLPHAAQR
jgi:hypothetical protein